MTAVQLNGPGGQRSPPLMFTVTDLLHGAFLGQLKVGRRKPGLHEGSARYMRDWFLLSVPTWPKS